MAEVKKVTLKRFNGTDDDTLHPTTEWEQVENKPSTFTPTAHTLNSHTDVDANPTADGQVLTWDADNSVWIAADSTGGGDISKADLQNVYIYGKASGAITKGQAIQFAGAQGGHILIKAAVPSEINAEPTLVIGIAETDLANNEFGYVIVNGRLNLNTSAYNAGDLLYFASAGSTAGALTTTEPTDPNASIQLAAVSIDGIGNGEFLVRKLLLTRHINEVIGLQGGLDSKVSKSGDTMTGNLEISNTLPKITFTDTNNNSDYHIANNNGTLEIADTTNQESRVQITSNGDVILPATGGLSLVDKAITNSSGALLWDGDEIYHEGHKPTLTELGAAAASHTHTFASLTSKPTTLSGYGITDAYSSSNPSGFQTAAQVATAVSGLVDSAPGTLNTLNELAAALGDDPNFATTVSNSIGTKVSKAGDTMTGDLYVKGDGSGRARIILTSTANQPNDLLFGTNNTEYWSITSRESSNPFLGLYNTVGAPGWAWQISNATNVMNFLVNPTVNGTAVSLAGHTHDDRYYTETESNNLLGGKYNFSAAGAIDVNSLSLGSQLYAGSSGSWTNRGPTGHNGSALLSIHTHSGNYYSQLWFNTSGDEFYHRSIDNGSIRGWAKVWTSANFNPASYSLTSHTHDDRYYTESEADGRFINTAGDSMTGLLVGQSNNTGGIAVASQGLSSLEAYSTGNAAAYMTFHKAGHYAVRFGLDTDNQLRVGGWSMGAVAYTIWHSGNLTLASLGYTGATNANYITNTNQLTNGSGYITSTASISGGSQFLGTERGTPDNALQYWQASGLGTTEAPNGDWHNTIRMSHGDPLSYYSNTLAIRMTGVGVGDIYTQTIMNGSAQGWKKHWNDGNDGSGSGLSADNVDGYHIVVGSTGSDASTLYFTT